MRWVCFPCSVLVENTDPRAAPLSAAAEALRPSEEEMTHTGCGQQSAAKYKSCLSNRGSECEELRVDALNRTRDGFILNAVDFSLSTTAAPEKLASLTSSSLPTLETFPYINLIILAR